MSWLRTFTLQVAFCKHLRHPWLAGVDPRSPEASFARTVWFPPFSASLARSGQQESTYSNWAQEVPLKSFSSFLDLSELVWPMAHNQSSSNEALLTSIWLLSSSFVLILCWYLIIALVVTTSSFSLGPKLVGISCFYSTISACLRIA